MPKELITPSRASDPIDPVEPYRCKSRRRILCIFPINASSFGTFQNTYPHMPRVAAFMPRQELLVIVAYLPDPWQVLRHIGLSKHQMIRFTRESLQGQGEACFYADYRHKKSLT